MKENKPVTEILIVLCGFMSSSDIFDQPSMSQSDRISKILLFGLMVRFTSKNIAIVF